MFSTMEYNNIPVTQPISQIGDPGHAQFDPTMMLHLPVSGLRDGIPPNFPSNPGVFMETEIPGLPAPFSPQMSEPQKMRHISLTQGWYKGY